MSLSGRDLVSALKAELGVESNQLLGQAIGYSTARIGQLENGNITPRIVAQMISKAQHAVIANSIEPIVEFFPLWKDHEGTNFLDKSQDDQARLRTTMETACGLYSFYNSEMEIIYVGRTKTPRLYNEMKNILNDRKMAHYQRYVVDHPRGEYRHTSTGAVRPIRRKEVTLWAAATHFSAYSASGEMARVMEAVLIRMMPNDLLNVRMEGQSLKMYRPDE